VTTGQATRRLAGHTDHVTSVAFAPDGRHAVSGSLDRTIKLWELPAGREVRTLSGHTYGLGSVAFSPDGRRILSSAIHDRTVRIWDAAGGRELLTLRQPSAVYAAALAPDGALVVVATRDESLRIWDVGSGTEVDRVDLGTSHDFVTALAFAPDGRSFLAGTWKGVLLRFALRPNGA
jgi:WD40 repeat protein